MPDANTATLTIDGLTVEARVEHTEHGPRLVVAGVNCDLDGDMPGSYYLVNPTN